MTRPRMRAADGTGELPVAAYELFSQTEVLGRMAMQRMLAGLSTRCYPTGLEPVGERVERSARSTSKSAVSRRFVAATENATLVTELIVGLRERVLDVTRPILAVLDGSKALRCAVLDVFDHRVIQRCQLHKIRNVKDRGPGSSPGCARPTTPTPRWPPKPSSRRSPASGTRPTLAPPRACARASPRRQQPRYATQASDLRELTHRRLCHRLALLDPVASI